MFACIETNIHQLNCAQWDAMNQDSSPFMQHAFLAGLELYKCVSPETGWQGQHVVIYRDKSKQQILAAMPCYLKIHSYGEYIFDWAWADAYQRAGLDYYPKLSCAFPFTPVTAERCLIAAGEDKEELENIMINILLDNARRLDVSSIHVLFTTPSMNRKLTENHFIERSSSQFHWHNADTPYKDFDDFLSTMSSRKRKNIKKERQKIAAQNVNFKWYTGKNITSDITQDIFGFYINTIYRYGAQQYLNAGFFKHFSQKLADSTHILLAYQNDQAIAGGLFFASNTSLYGRYWGASKEVDCLHFETCYYQPIEYAIQQGWQQFEAGAQGEHKLARGLLPVKTHSMHWLAHPEFKDAILDYTQTEAEHIERYNKLLNDHGPFRKDH